ncbi:hypothetical protein EK21DRAFT_93772 [Setomelanomma holmii]|uniref:Uncharacterized protein n=1 Tax=Setomelanomma holmii TaxID=210430 RepID=A0A9P4GY71_9PLEO|nr:hypothetical protein EK21DRAFT_93772 [Setomelanomma holmii]
MFDAHQAIFFQRQHSRHDARYDVLTKNGSVKTRCPDGTGYIVRAVPNWIIRQAIRANFIFWESDPEWPLEGTVVAKTGEAPELHRITRNKNKKDHRVVAILQQDMKPLLIGKLVGKECEREVRGRRCVEKQYTINTSIIPQMQGPDLVLTWVWLGKLETADRKDSPRGS